MSSMASGGGDSAPMSNNPKKQENRKPQLNSDIMSGCGLWTGGLICAFEFVRVRKKTVGPKSGSTQSFQEVSVEESKKEMLGCKPANSLAPQVYENKSVEFSPTKESEAGEVYELDDNVDKKDYNSYKQDYHLRCSQVREWSPGSYWVPIGWARITELVQIVQGDAGWASQTADLTEDEDDTTVADVAAPYWEQPKGPTWWCHVMAGHPFVNGWFSNAQWLHPAISVALRDESKLISERMKHLRYEVIRVKWSLHAREEIVFELLQHLRGNAARNMLEGIRKSTREMIDEQEAVRGRLFTIQDVIQSTVRACLQDQSLRVSHNLGVFGGCGLVLSIITGLFGINVDGIPGSENSPYAFALFSGLLILLGIALIAIGLLYLGLRKPVTEELVEVRKLELQELVKIFQVEAETHAQVRKTTRTKMPRSAAAGILPDGAGYVLIAD